MPAPRKILLNPGPCTTTERVKQALVMSDLCPREQEFGDLVARVRSDLLAVAHAAGSHTAVLIPGSGTAAVESTLASVVGPEDRVLIIDNGAYGRRAVQIARLHGLAHRTLQLGWGEFPEPARVAARLDEAPACTHCFLVHHETTTGMLNPLAEVSALCRARGVSLIVDAMSSLGGVRLDVRATPADYVISSANKCLQGLPGLSFVLADRAALARSADFPRRSLYLDLHAQWHAQEHERQFLFTPPVQVLNALAAALAEYFSEGPAARHARYAACHERLVAGMEALGFVPLVPPPWRSGLLTAFLEPDDPAWSFDALHDWLFARGITIYPGKIAATRTFRLATIGDLTTADIDAVIAQVEAFCRARTVFAPPTPAGMTSEPLPPYVYHCEDRSILLEPYRRLIVPIWSWWVPRWLPANVITLGSSACMWVVFGLSLQAADYAAAPLALVFLGLTQIYLGYDHVDGMQAKSTGTSSALGEFLDHSLDVYHGAIVVIASCALIGSAPRLLVLGVVWCTLVAFAATMLEQKERGALFFGPLGAIEAMFLFNSFFVSWLFPAVREWWLAPLFAGLPAYSILVVLGSIGCLGSAVDCLRRIGRLPAPFAAYLGTSLALAVAVSGTPMPFWAAITALLLHSGDYAGRVIGSHLLRRPHAWPDFAGPAVAVAGAFGPRWLGAALLGWLALRTAWGIVGIVTPLRRDWRWRNPPLPAA